MQHATLTHGPCPIPTREDDGRWQHPRRFRIISGKLWVGYPWNFKYWDHSLYLPNGLYFVRGVYHGGTIPRFQVVAAEGGQHGGVIAEGFIDSNLIVIFDPGRSTGRSISPGMDSAGYVVREIMKGGSRIGIELEFPDPSTLDDLVGVRPAGGLLLDSQGSATSRE